MNQKAIAPRGKTAHKDYPKRTVVVSGQTITHRPVEHLSDDEAIESMKSRAKIIKKKDLKMRSLSPQPPQLPPKPPHKRKKVKSPRPQFQQKNREVVNLMDISLDLQGNEARLTKRPKCHHKIIINSKSSNAQQLPYRFLIT